MRELIESGNVRPSIAAVAARSGINAATIHRRWGSIDALLLDVAVAEVNEREPVQTTGRLRQDLLLYARQVQENVSRPDGLSFLRTLVAAASNPTIGPEGALVLLGARLEQFEQLLRATGTSSALTVEDLVDGLLAPVYLRALLSHPSTLEDHNLIRLVDNLIAVDQARLDSSSGGSRDR